jgi:hypothetical protein
VEGFATKREWRRGYEEINQFERLLVEDGIRIAKIFLHISPGEQIRRFKDRVNNPLKRWKLSYEDFRNRERWADYEIAIEDMIEKTSTKRAPWYLVPTNDKLFGRIAAGLFHDLSHGRSTRVALFPPNLDECITAYLGVRAAPNLLVPEPGEDNALQEFGWYAQVGQALARVVGWDRLLQAYTGVQSWSAVLSPALSRALHTSIDGTPGDSGAPLVVCTYTGAVSGNAYTVTGFYPKSR